MAKDVSYWTSGTKKPVPCLKLPAATDVASIFDRLDKDKSGTLDKKELGVFVREAGKALRQFISAKEEREFWPKALSIMKKAETDTWTIADGRAFLDATVNTINHHTKACEAPKPVDIAKLMIRDFDWSANPSTPATHSGSNHNRPSTPATHAKGKRVVASTFTHVAGMFYPDNAAARRLAAGEMFPSAGRFVPDDAATPAAKTSHAARTHAAGASQVPGTHTAGTHAPGTHTAAGTNAAGTHTAGTIAGQ